MAKTTFLFFGVACDAAIWDSKRSGEPHYIAPAPGGGFHVFREQTPECQCVTQLVKTVGGRKEWIVVKARLTDLAPESSGT